MLNMVALKLWILFFVQMILVSAYLDQNVEDLTKNLFQNLEAHPILLGDLEFSEDSKGFIDRQVTNYINLITNSEETEYARSKRSLQETETTFENHFIDIKPFKRIPTKFPRDIILFQQDLIWYAACLENEINGTSSQKLKIKKLVGSTTEEVASIDTLNGVAVATISLNTSTIIMVAENTSARQHFEHQTNIMKFDSKEQLKIIQKINTSYSSHVQMWEVEKNIYMAVARFMKEGPPGTRLEVDTPIYKWRGRHFDLIQFIGTSGVSKISPFSIGGVHFLAVANSKSDDHDTPTYSEIFRYDVDKEQYQQFQKIRTYGCKDITIVRIQLKGEEEEHFLVVANTNGKDNTGTNHQVPSIVYKFVDDYFIPFQSIKIKGVTEWLPVTVENGEVILFAATVFDGIKCFHYNGWNFVESQIETKNDATSSGIKAMHFYKYQDKTIVVIANENDKGNMDNMFEIGLTSKNELKRVYKEMFMWCLDTKKRIEMKDVDILGNPLRGDISVTPQAESQSQSEDQMQTIRESIKIHMTDLEEIEHKLNKSLQQADTNVIHSDIKANHVIVNNDTFTNSITAETINKFKVDNILDNVLDINKGFETDSIEFNVVHLGDKILPKTINDFPADSIILKREIGNVDNLVIHGMVTFLTDFNVGKINNVIINSTSTLLKNGSQSFQDFIIENIHIDELEAEIMSNSTGKLPKQKLKSVEKLKELKATKLTINGYLNNLDLTTLKKYTLKVRGNQKISKNYQFDKIEANNLNTSTLSHKQVFRDMIVINQGKHRVKKDVRFAKLVVNNLKALKYLDSIPVKDGKPDILLKDSTERQYISGMKGFENLELLNPIQLRGKMRGRVLDTMNPSVTIDTNLDLNGDIRITGDVIAEEIIKSNDIVSADGAGALRRVRQQGLKLTDTEIPIHLNFAQHINVEGVFVDRINNIDPRSWVVNGAKQAQIIGGWKRFQGDLEITGDTRVFRINDIDIADLEKNVLRQDGDQVISGKHYVKMVVAEKGINSNSTKIGSHQWNDVVTVGDQTLDNVTTFTNLACDKITAKNLNIFGLLNNLNISEILNDVAIVDRAFKIFGHKTLKSVGIENLKAKNNFNFVTKVKSWGNGTVKLIGDMDVLNKIPISNIHFNESCNSVRKNNFTVIKGQQNESHLIYGSQNFDTIKVFPGTVYVESNFINEVNFTDFVNNTVKIDEPFEFVKVIFNKVIVNGNIDLRGHIDHLDIDNIFRNDETDSQVIMDQKIFEEDVSIEGNANFVGTLNGLNISDLCDFTADEKSKSLIIAGNSYFSKGPHVSRFDGYDVKSLENMIWFNNKPVTVNGYIKFKNNVTFQSNVTVLELVNGANLNLIQANYLSKTKNQTVMANINFLDRVLFEENISSSSLNLGTQINDINIESFVKSILLNDEQLFEDIVYLENCHIADVEGDYLINNMSFENDIMRYDKLNIVSGHKKFVNTDIDNLLINNNTFIQNVDILQWINKGVLTKGTFRVLGNKRFKNITLPQGVSLEGLLNGIKFNADSIMLKNVPQNVTGRKMFVEGPTEGVTFKALKIMGLVNGVDVAELARNQALKTGNNIFKSKIHFYNNISTKNVMINDLYDGVNVTELLKNVTALGALNNFEENYRHLQGMYQEIENSLAGQAYFLHYYKSLPYIPFAEKIFSKVDEGESQIITVNYENESTLLKLFEWNEKINIFEDKTEFRLNLIPDFIDQVRIGPKDYIYIEIEMDPAKNAGYRFLGRLIYFEQSLTNTTELGHSFLQTNGTLFVTSFELEVYNQYCLIFINYEQTMQIICIDPHGEYWLLQEITEKLHKVSAINMNGKSYLVTITRETPKEEPPTSIWKFSNKTSRFELHQRIYEGYPISLTTVTYKGRYYVAVAYGHLQNTMDLGRVVIRRFDKETEEFILWQNIHLGTPTHIEFSILPSEELVLYILTQNPTEPLIVYVYEGISGFSKKIVGSAIPHVLSMNQFSANNKHFVVTQHFNGMNIIQAIFKGEKL